MRQCLTLALLLHIWLVLMFGNATGTARPGDGVWGRLNVSLGDSKSTVEAASNKGRQPAQAELSEGAIGKARQQRFGGSVRPLEDKPKPTTPGAAELGRWREQRAPAARPADQPSEVAPAAPAPQVRTLTAAAPRPSTIAPVSGLVAAANPAAATLIEPAPLPSATVRVMEEAAPAAAVTRSQRSTVASPLPIAPQFKPLATIAAEPVVAPVPAPVPEPVKLLAAPAELGRQQKSEVTALAPTAATPPLAAMAASAVAAPAATIEPVPASRAVPANPVSTPSGPAPVSALASSTPSLLPAVPAQPQPGAPEAGPRLGYDVATPASTAATPPRLNLNLPRGGELSSRGSSGVLQLLPAPPERKSKLSEDLEKAAKEDCRKAYGEKVGLLAVVPLVLDAARSNKGCRW